MFVDFQNPDDQEIARILREKKHFALVGASHKEQRPSFQVMNFLLENGYTVYPINPGRAGKEILGQTVYPNLAELPYPVDIIDVFRNSDAALGVVQEVLTCSSVASTIWMQLGVINEEAADIALSAGMQVIMDRCPKIEYKRLIGNGA